MRVGATIGALAMVSSAGFGVTGHVSAAPSRQFHGTVKIGVIGAFTGNEGFLGPDLMTGVKTAAAEINAAGGILGKKVVFTSADDAGDAVDAVPAFRKMVSVDKPAAIIGPFSMTGPAVMPLIRQNQVPTFQIGGTTQLDHTRVNYFWRANASDDQEGTADAYWAIHQHYKTAAFAYTTDASASTLEAPTRSAYVHNGGKVVITANLVPDASSYRSDILKIMAAHPQVVFFQQDPQTAGTFFNEVAQLGFDTKTHWIGTDVEFSSDVFKALGSKIATTNMVFTNNSLQNGAATKAFIKRYQSLYHTKVAAVAAPEGYDSVIVAALAMQKAGSIQGAKWNRDIMAVSNPPGTKVYTFAQGKRLLAQHKKINYEGVGSSVDFNQYHNVIGPFGVYHFSTSGSILPTANITSAKLEHFHP
jgi:branched-chain amino acid transport system substrate-binding protein